MGRLVGRVATARLQKNNPYSSRLPVICIGNFTVGGSGKTPLALLVAKLVADEGLEPWYLSRGYGGRLPGPTRVDAALHGSVDVGDEPLLLARRAPTVVSRDRSKGAQFIETIATPNAVIIMDDGLQNRSLAKDLVIAVISEDRGFGNGRVIPAGPLRAPLDVQIGLADAIVVTGQGNSRNRALREPLHTLTPAPIFRPPHAPRKMPQIWTDAGSLHTRASPIRTAFSRCWKVSAQSSSNVARSMIIMRSAMRKPAT